MSSGADLFVVCKQCGSEVSPYITECPYCGSRLRRRAPKLPRVQGSNAPAPRRRRLVPLLGRGAASRGGVGTATRVRALRPGASSRWAASPPRMTMVLVAVSCIGWILWHAEPRYYLETSIFGPLNGHWWRLFTYGFAYTKGLYAFIAIVAIAIFGWLLERRHGPVVVAALFFGAGAAAALVAVAAYPVPWVSGGNAAALALMAAWAAPDLRAARAGSFYEGDLLGVAVLAALLLVTPFVIEPPEASWLAGVVGGAIGLVVGLGLGAGDA
jgi:membrane associated rhomboid family serine protease